MPEEKTKEQLQWEIDLLIKLEIERKSSDNRYAAKLVERVLWSLLATAFLFLSAWYFSHLQESKKPTTNVQQLVLPSSQIQ